MAGSGIHANPSPALVRRIVSLGLWLLALTAPALNAQPATLVADRVALNSAATITASGNVEILYRGDRLRAPRITYDSETDRLAIDGPMTLEMRDGTLVLADAANLDSRFRQGVIESARLVLQQQFRITADRAQRIGGHQTRLYHTTASSCRVCDTGPPLWQIRAEQVIHDSRTRQLHFFNARFELGGVPVMYLPRLRMPGPDATRATGFLVPRYSGSTLLGHGVRIPYFIAMGDHQDLLLRPYLAQKTRTLEYRYRRALRRGNIEVSGALSSDDLHPASLRYHLAAKGDFALPRDFALAVDAQALSDPAYGPDYGHTGDRLQSSASVTRTRRHEHVKADAALFSTLRAAELPLQPVLPGMAAGIAYVRRLPAGALGQVQLDFGVRAHRRDASAITPATLAACAAAPGIECTARDVIRTHADISWRRDWQFGRGMIGAIEARLDTSHFAIAQDPDFPDDVLRTIPTIATGFRWPLRRQTASGAVDLLEPMLHIAWSAPKGPTVPKDDDSIPFALDDGDFPMSDRLSGGDRITPGWRVVLGLRWQRALPSGVRFGAGVGRVLRGIDPARSDGAAEGWLISGTVRTAGGLGLSGRVLADSRLAVQGTETRLGWSGDRLSFAASHLWTAAGQAKGHNPAASELELGAGLQIGRRWTGNLHYRHDLATGTRGESAVKMTYNNECVQVGLSWRRRAISSRTGQIESVYGLHIALNGIGSDARSYRRGCRG